MFNGADGFATGFGDIPDAVGECATIQRSLHEYGRQRQPARCASHRGAHRALPGVREAHRRSIRDRASLPSQRTVAEVGMSTLQQWVPATLFARAHGARLAYQSFGEGEHDIVAIPPLAQNIEIAWEEPDIRAMLERFASFSRYVHFDKRGTGASDRRSAVPGIDERVEDLRAVMDAAGVGSAHLFVQSDGGPMAILFAATYPERVESLILCGSFAALDRPDR